MFQSLHLLRYCPTVHVLLALGSYVSFARRRSLPVACVDLSPPSHVRGGVIVYVDCTSPFHLFGLLVALASA